MFYICNIDFILIDLNLFYNKMFSKLHIKHYKLRGIGNSLKGRHVEIGQINWGGRNSFFVWIFVKLYNGRQRGLDDIKC